MSVFTELLSGICKYIILTYLFSKSFAPKRTYLPKNDAVIKIDSNIQFKAYCSEVKKTPICKKSSPIFKSGHL